MRDATFERSTSPTRPHVIVVDHGEGDRREMTIQAAQHLFESLGMALADYESYMVSGDRRMAKRLRISADVE